MNCKLDSSPLLSRIGTTRQLLCSRAPHAGTRLPRQVLMIGRHGLGSLPDRAGPGLCFDFRRAASASSRMRWAAAIRSRCDSASASDSLRPMSAFQFSQPKPSRWFSNPPAGTPSSKKMYEASRFAALAVSVGACHLTDHELIRGAMIAALQGGAELVERRVSSSILVLDV